MTWMAVFVLVLDIAFAASAQQDESVKSGDLVYVTVQRHPELSTTTQVDEQGAIQLPFVGLVNIGGLSEKQAGARVSGAFKTIMRNPRVTLARSTATRGAPIVGRSANMETRVIELHNASAVSIAQTLSGMSTAGGSISAFPEGNSVIITDSSETLQSMISAITQLDQMKSQLTQVRIDTWIAEVESLAVKEMGIRFFAQGDHTAAGYTPTARQDTRLNAFRGNIDPLFNESLQSGSTGNNRSSGNTSRRFLDNQTVDRRLQIPAQVAAPGQMFLGFMTNGIDIGAFLDALAADNNAELLSTSHTTVVNHMPSQIKNTAEVPFTEIGSSGLTSVANVKFLDIGVILDVTPHVLRDPEGVRYVKLELAPEVSTASGLGTGGVPIRTVRSTKGVHTVRDRQTIVIGGIIQNDTRKADQRVPGVSRIPFLGNIFKHKERSKTRRELMIFVTPTIFDQPEDITWESVPQLTQLDTEDEKLPPFLTLAEERKE